MALSEYKQNMEQCARCSCCKFVAPPYVESYQYAIGCPSIGYGNFHAYSGGGKVITSLALTSGVIDYSEEMLKTVHACSMCGNCAVSCKFNYAEKVEPLEIIRELRCKIVEDGQSDPAHIQLINYLKREDNIFGGPKADRSAWAEGLGIKDALEEKAEVLLHVGCHYSYDETLWPIIRGAARLLQEAGVDFGIAKKEEICCGGRAYEMGYRQELASYSESLKGRVKEAGCKILLTCCSDCYGSFQQLYPIAGQGLADVEVLHISQYLERLTKEGKLSTGEKVPLRVTYHDPCHLGRLGEPSQPWHGTVKKVLNMMDVTDPPKDVSFGVGGVYDAPRSVLQGIPGVELVEMERIKEYSFCCGAGGGAKEAYPDFALKTALERIEEARSTGAEALVTSCPWCVRNFRDALEESGQQFPVYDLVELVLKGMGTVKKEGAQ
ncbi:MAG: (Fe-S)-binding protein [Desulfuromonadaceae bacterium]|nr:(Fe-S)-binding protein [Desulfuromonadaceae bacterium]